jgi:hypothetical protein
VKLSWPHGAVADEGQTNMALLHVDGLGDHELRVKPGGLARDRPGWT